MRLSSALRASVLGFLWAVAPAFAADVDTELDAISSSVDTLLRRSKVLADQLSPGSGYINEDLAIQRYQDYVFLHMVGDYAPAAEGFFTLVTSGALGDAGLHYDAEWYLADSLYQMGNMATAEVRFLVIMDDDSHPFRTDSVRRLLELYATTGRTDDFYRMYDIEVSRGRVESTDMVSYALGKAFYAQDETREAVARFEQVSTDSSWYGRSQYYLGVIGVEAQDFKTAQTHFQLAAEQSIDSPDARTVHDLAVLAQARLLFENEDYRGAVEVYDTISGDSEFSPEKLYETVWCHIKLENWTESLRVVEIFLIAHPDHAYTAQLELIQGHLHVAQSAFDRALSQYESVVSGYEPIRREFAAMAEVADRQSMFDDLVAVSRGGEAAGDLPAFAMSMILEDADLGRAISVYDELDQQASDISKSEDLIRELRGVLTSGDGITGFEQMRYDAVLTANQAAENSLMLLEVEENYLLDTLPVNQRPKVDPLQARRLHLVGAARDSAYRVEEAREALERYQIQVRRVRRDTAEIIGIAREHSKEIADLRRELEAGGTELDDVTRKSVLADLTYLEREVRESSSVLEALDLELSNLRAPPEQRAVIRNQGPVEDLLGEIDKLRYDYSAIRPGNRLMEVPERVDGLHHSLNRIHERLERVSRELATVETGEIESLRERFQTEVEAVALQRIDHEKTLAAAERVSLELTAAGFGRLEDFFAESVLKADMGIIDVYWAQKLQTVDEIARIKNEKKALLVELDRRFELILQKMDR